MTDFFLASKLLLVFVPQGCGRAVVDASKKGGARGGTKVAGYGHGVSSCAMTECGNQDIVLILLYDERKNVIEAVVEEALHASTGYTGTALLLNVPKTLIRSGILPREGTTNLDSTGGEAMQSNYTMISSIINHGQAEELMAVARAAGAQGGTILNARGTGTEDDVEFFGISFAPEKELLLIIADNSRADTILKALSSQPVFSEPGGGIIFTTGIEQLIALGV